MQATVGVALGYGIGVIVTNAAVSVAVFVGQPVTLTTQVSARVAGLLAVVYMGLIGIGVAGGVVAAWPAVRTPPADVSGWREPSNGRTGDDGWLAVVRTRMRPSLLGWRPLVPTATTLAVFIAFVIVAASTYGIVAPVAADGGATVTEPGAAHPIASQVPQAHATTLRDQGVAASPEILLLTARGDQPFMARGANFSAFASLSDARLRRGEPPTRPGDAVIGADLAQTLDVRLGERILLGGSTTPAVAYRERLPLRTDGVAVCSVLLAVLRGAASD